MTEKIGPPGTLQLYLLLLLAENSRKPELAARVVTSIKLIDSETKCWFKSEWWSDYTSIDKKPAHRVSYDAFIGNPIEGLEICHHCDRKGCINPFHLFQGTHSDNVQDAIVKGRIFPVVIQKSEYSKTQKQILEAKQIITKHGELFGSVQDLVESSERVGKK